MRSRIALAGVFSAALLLAAGCGGDIDNDDDDNIGPAGVQAPSQSGDSDPTPSDAGTLNNQQDPGAPADGGTGTQTPGTQQGTESDAQNGANAPGGEVPTPQQTPDVQPADQQ